MAKIHPLAVVAPSAQLADDVVVGPGAVVEAGVVIGPGTVLRPHAVVRTGTTLGMRNLVDSFAVLGGDPQDLGFDPRTETFLKVGDDNTFREGVTISRATKPGGATTVGDKTLWMANSHAGHDCRIGNGVIIVNSTLLAGHVVVGERAILSGGTAVHQFTWIGEMVMTQGHSGLGMHVPPFVMCAEVNQVVGLNIIGLKRNPALSDDDRKQVKEAFRLTYRAGLPRAKAVEAMDACQWGPAASSFRDFVKRVLAAEKPHNRGLCPLSSDS
ncbi:MAG: acyl-ACP--UDP-N-acetylglucosamine O-acyltransferase [Elusimicrobia bacterium]|nr:acyl-ACP--UDP-N-acetylglucosamine O-acyltransferase [Elusimicrobiota bacterium]